MLAASSLFRTLVVFFLRCGGCRAIPQPARSGRFTRAGRSPRPAPRAGLPLGVRCWLLPARLAPSRCTFHAAAAARAPLSLRAAACVSVFSRTWCVSLLAVAALSWRATRAAQAYSSCRAHRGTTAFQDVANVACLVAGVYVPVSAPPQWGSASWQRLVYSFAGRCCVLLLTRLQGCVALFLRGCADGCGALSPYCVLRTAAFVLACVLHAYRRCVGSPPATLVVSFCRATLFKECYAFCGPALVRARARTRLAAALVSWVSLHVRCALRTPTRVCSTRAWTRTALVRAWSLCRGFCRHTACIASV